MQTVQRQFGRFMKRSADDSQVAILLKDFDQIDKLLDKIVDSTQAWHDAWSSLLTYQHRVLAEFEGLYAPIPGSSEAHTPVPTPEATLARTTKLKGEYEDMKIELLGELAEIDNRMISPASQAKEYLIPFKKTIKKRDDRKLDYERHQGRVDTLSKRAKRSDRENTSLTKAEEDLAKATEEYHAADEHLRQHLPQLINAIFSLLPRLLAAQIEIQNHLLGNYYTVIYNYCQQEQLPSNPPQSLEETVSQWEQAYHPIQEQVENFACLANRKAVPSQSQSPSDRRPSNPLNTLNRFRSNHNLRTQQSSDAKPIPAYDAKPSLGLRSKSTPSSIPGHYTTSQPEPHSDNHLYPSRVLSTKPSIQGLAGKKKPPPPPPRPRNASSHGTFVTALYDFGGQNAGDLAFQQGDRIRVLKQTDSTDDWWEGELRGFQGSFPANYVELVE